jgi:phage/plasmid-associated DNA primase
VRCKKKKLTEQQKLDADDENYEQNKDNLQKKLDNIEILVKKIDENKTIKDCCIDSIIPYIEDDDIKFENNPYAFCFKNKVYDLKQMAFVNANREDYMCICTGYDYRAPTDEEMNTVRALFASIFRIESERTLYLTLLATGLFGQTLEKFVLANGGGRNGKGVANELVSTTLGNYCYEGGNDILMSPIKQDRANPALNNMNNKRLTFYREPDTQSLSANLLNAATIKELTGGNTVSARTVYSGDTTTKLRATHILECNEKPKLSGGECGEAMGQRLLDVGFHCTFTRVAADVDEENLVFLGNDKYKETSFREDHKFAMFHLLLEYWGDYMKADKNIEKFVPQSIRDRNDTYLKSGNEIYTWFVATFEKEEPGEETGTYVAVSKIYDEFKAGEIWSNYTKNEKRKLNLKSFMEKIQTNPYLRRDFKASHRPTIGGGKQLNASNVLLKWKLKDSLESDDDGGGYATEPQEVGGSP